MLGLFNIKNIFTFLLACILVFAKAQQNVDFKQLHAGGNKTMRTGVAISPDGKHVAMAGMQGTPLFIYDWRQDKIINEFNVGNWYAGSKVSYSTTGKYILLQRIFAIDWAPNKDREGAFEIVDATTGKVVKKVNNVHSLKIANDESFFVSLSGDEVTFYELPSGKKTKSFTVLNATNSVAISPDGSTIAVSHRPTLDQVKGVPSIRNNKKAIKPAMKYRQMISLYETSNFTKIKTVNELYDIVYRLQFSRKGERLFCYSIPHLKMQVSSAGRQGYINTIDMPSGEPARTSFVSLASYEPDFIENKTQKLFGVVSFDMAPQINIYDYANGKMLARFDTRQRIFAGMKKQMYVDGKASFAFLPNRSIIITTGNQTILWRPDLN